MIYLNSFIFVGLVSMIGQIILDNTKLTPGHITSIFVILGAFLDVFSIYDKIVRYVGGGALVPITSFGHLLTHGAMMKANTYGFVGIAMGMFDFTASGITSAIFFAFLFSLFFKPRD
jgi:stage V sporulation protein AE